MLQLILAFLAVGILAGLFGMRGLQGAALRIAGILIAVAIAAAILIVLAILALT